MKADRLTTNRNRLWFLALVWIENRIGLPPSSFARAMRIQRPSIGLTQSATNRQRNACENPKISAGRTASERDVFEKEKNGLAKH